MSFVKKENNSKNISEEKNKSYTIADKLQAYFKPTDIQKDILRYKSNSFARSLCFLAILCNCLGFCFVYSTMTKVTFITGVDIVYNILFLLMTFLTAEQIKVYNKKASIYALLLGVLSIAHYFWYILPLYTSEAILSWVMVADLILFISAGAMLIISAIANFFRSSILYNYLKEASKTESAAALELKSKMKKGKF